MLIHHRLCGTSLPAEQSYEACCRMQVGLLLANLHRSLPCSVSLGLTLKGVPVYFLYISQIGHEHRIVKFSILNIN